MAGQVPDLCHILLPTPPNSGRSGWSAASVKTSVQLSPLRRHGRRLALALTLGALVLTARVQASERWATLEAIHQLENPTNSEAPGPRGELGAYQFRESVWHMYTRAPFRNALDRRASDSIAVKHYEWIKTELQRMGVNVSPYTIALAWNGGINAALGDNPPSSTLDYAARAANIAAELERREVADSP
jgi:hypothetical protein